jgi:hypothetical protein
VVHVDLKNGGLEDGSAVRPYSTIHGAASHTADGDTIKVAQGTYSDNVGLPYKGEKGLLLLGGFAGIGGDQYDGKKSGDFVLRTTDLANPVTTIQAKDKTKPTVDFQGANPAHPQTYAVDGFTLTGGVSGVKVIGSGDITFVISQNRITGNGDPKYGNNGGGILVNGVQTLVLNNRIDSNQAYFGGGFYIGADKNSFLIQGNTIEDNVAVGDLGGGGSIGQIDSGQGMGLFTGNIVRRNHANTSLNYGTSGGLQVSGGPMELSRNIYSDNWRQGNGGAIFCEGTTNAVLRHELVYKNRNNLSAVGSAGIYVDSKAKVTLHHCTIAKNISPYSEGNGLKVQEYATVEVNNSIIWDNDISDLYIYPGANFTINYSTYSGSQTYPGYGAKSVDPKFADTDKDNYHLRSMGGSWDPAISGWVVDKDGVHSPCIDAGNPTAPFDNEPKPNGGRANMGVYGNTPEASKSQ